MADATAAQIAEARSQGYSDDEIVKHLASTSPKFKEAVDAGYSPQEIVGHFIHTDRSAAGALMYGINNAVTGLGQTYDLATGAPIRPNADQGDYSPASPSKGFSEGKWPGIKQTARYGLENLPPALGALAGGALAAWAAPAAIPGAAAAALGGTGAGMLLSTGGSVKARADAMGHEEPTTADKAIGTGTAAASSLIGSLPVSRFLPGANKIVSTGVKGIADSAAKLAATTGAEAVAAGGSNLASQVGTTAGTPGGVRVDPSQVADNAIGGAAGAAALRAIPAAADVRGAIKYSKVTPENAEAAAAVSQRLKDAATGNLANLTEGLSTVKKVQEALKSELGDAAAGKDLPVEAKTALSQAGSLNPGELSALKTALGNDPQSDAVMHLVRQAQMADLARSQGHEANGKLTGGLSGALGRVPFLNSIPKLMLATAGAHFIPGAGFIPAGVGAAGLAAHVAARGIDKMTGARSPIGAFQKRFSQPGAQVRLAPPSAPAAPAAPPTGASVPLVPPRPQPPWGVTPPWTPKQRQTPPPVSMFNRGGPDALINDLAAAKSRAFKPPLASSFNQSSDALINDLAAEPQVTKVSKANGKVAHTIETPPPVETPPMAEAMEHTPFEPKSIDEMPLYGMSHKEAAEHQAAVHADVKDPELYKQQVMGKRRAEETRVFKAINAATSPADKVAGRSLLHELYNTSSRRRAREARDHYAAQMSPDVAKIIREHVTDAFINKSKGED